MRVLVELFDPEPIENILGSCIYKPEIVLLLCDERQQPLVQEGAISRFLRQRGIKARPRFYYFNASSPEEIQRTLAEVVAEYPDCVFEFTGGRDLVLLEAGAFCERNRLPGFYLDIHARRFINVRGCERLAAQFIMPSLSVEEIFLLTGATIHGYGHYRPADLNAEFRRQALLVWDVVRKSPKQWGEFVNFLQGFCSASAMATLDVSGSLVLRGRGGSGTLRCNTGILAALERAGAIEWFIVEGEKLRLCFASVLFKRCLLNQGIWLELYCYFTAHQSRVFDDVRTSVVVDWSGINGEANNTKNEVDVLLVKGVVPVFISCKMSAPSPLALSEIMLLARKFGRQMGRAVLVCYTRLGRDYKAIRQRAKDLDIALIDREAIDAGQLIPLLEGLVK